MASPTGIVDVYLWGTLIGKLSWSEKARNSYFYFSDDYFRMGVDIAPLTYPISSPTTRMAIWGNRNDRTYSSLPSFLSDSLPNGWGSTLFGRWTDSKHISNADRTSLLGLSFIGRRGMGALEFVPVADPELEKVIRIDLESLLDESSKIKDDVYGKRIDRFSYQTSQALIAVGTSADGRQGKAVAAITPDGDILSGQIPSDPTFRQCMVKFGDPLFCQSEIEYIFYKLARNAGITMMESSLITVGEKKQFLTERFDRPNGQKIFTQTLAAMNPCTRSYEDAFRTCRMLGLPYSEMRELFKRTAFNFLSGNTDDHSRNISFLMDRDGKWHLAPAYDQTFILGADLQPYVHHSMFIGGKDCSVGEADLLDFAKRNDVRNPRKVIEEIYASLSGFRQIAKEVSLPARWTGTIEKELQRLAPERFKSLFG